MTTYVSLRLTDRTKVRRTRCCLRQRTTARKAPSFASAAVLVLLQRALATFPQCSGAACNRTLTAAQGFLFHNRVTTTAWRRRAIAQHLSKVSTELINLERSLERSAQETVLWWNAFRKTKASLNRVKNKDTYFSTCIERPTVRINTLNLFRLEETSVLEDDWADLLSTWQFAAFKLVQNNSRQGGRIFVLASRCITTRPDPVKWKHFVFAIHAFGILSLSLFLSFFLSFPLSLSFSLSFFPSLACQI